MVSLGYSGSHRYVGSVASEFHAAKMAAEHYILAVVTPSRLWRYYSSVQLSGLV